MTLHNAQRYPFVAADHRLGEASLRPILPTTLGYQDRSIDAIGLLDTGAMVNVPPYRLGQDLGATWEAQATPLQLTGNLAQYEAKALLVSAVIGQFEPIQLVFAWTRAEEVPLLLGQVNFFVEFDACFYRSQLAFELRPKSASA